MRRMSAVLTFCSSNSTESAKMSQDICTSTESGVPLRSRDNRTFNCFSTYKMIKKLRYFNYLGFAFNKHEI